MYKICFNQYDNIIGFDLSNPINYINLFNINDISKERTEYEYAQKKDTFGRKLYYITNNKDGIKTEIAYTDIENCKYEPIMLKTPFIKNVNLVNEPNFYNIDDIINIKQKQLISKFNCSDCILYELMDETESLKFNVISGKNIIRIPSNGETVSNKIILSNCKNVNIYYESDKDLKVQISSDGENFSDIEKDSFNSYINDEIYIKFICTEETNIYCIAILIK